MTHSKFTILIVDDNQNNRFALKTLIERYLDDLRVLEAASGPEAIDLAVATRPLDLIILDVQMPEMDGFQTASMLKIRKKTRDIPIIFLTAAYKTQEFQQRGYQVGAVDYLLKPIDDNQLINKIGTYVRLIEQERDQNRRLEEMVRQRTAELDEARAYLQNIINSMGEALLVLGNDGKIQRVNPAACRMLDYTDSALVGLSIGDVFEEEDQEKATAFMGTWLEALVRTGVISNIEATFIRKDGTRIPILFSRSALSNEQGEIGGIICIAKDMSDFRRLEEALADYQDDDTLLVDED
ncbi:MAG: response regulator [Chromatiales bacterium]|nr:response regulator [Chromatiales bacterium]